MVLILTSHSIEWNAEELLIRLCQPDERLEGIPLLHHDLNVQAQINCVVFKAEVQERSLEGAKPSLLNVVATFSTDKTPEEADAVVNAITYSIYNTHGDADLTLPDIVFASIEPEARTRQEDAQKLRKRVITVPVLIKLSDLDGLSPA